MTKATKRNREECNRRRKFKADVAELETRLIRALGGDWVEAKITLYDKSGRPITSPD
jgi:hypothetical protein